MVFDARRSDDEPSSIQSQQHTNESYDGERKRSVKCLLSAWVLAAVEHCGNSGRSSRVTKKFRKHIRYTWIAAERLCCLCSPEGQFSKVVQALSFLGSERLRYQRLAEVAYCGDPPWPQGFCCNVRSATYWNAGLGSIIVLQRP